MSNLVPANVREAAHAADEDLFLQIGGITLRGWKSFSLTRSVQTVPMTLSIHYTDAFPGTSEVSIQGGDAIVASLGGSKVLTGRVDRVAYSISADEHSVELVARSALRNLVDCSCDFTALGGGQIINGNILTIARQVCQPFGIHVILTSTQPLVQIPSFTVNYGETGWSVIERVSRYAGVLLLDDSAGNLIIADVGGSTMASGVIQGQNLLTASREFSVDTRYSDYYVVPSAVNTTADYGPASFIFGHAQDHEIAKLEYRPLYIISEQSLDIFAFSQKRADWEAASRFGRAHTIRARVDSWRAADGSTWQPNAAISLNIPSIKMATPNTVWVIQRVTFDKSIDGGTTADLTIVPKEGLIPQPLSLANISQDYASGSIRGIPGAQQGNDIQTGPAVG